MEGGTQLKDETILYIVIFIQSYFDLCRVSNFIHMVRKETNEGNKVVDSRICIDQRKMNTTVIYTRDHNVVDLINANTNHH